MSFKNDAVNNFLKGLVSESVNRAYDDVLRGATEDEKEYQANIAADASIFAAKKKKDNKAVDKDKKAPKQEDEGEGDDLETALSGDDGSGNSPKQAEPAPKQQQEPAAADQEPAADQPADDADDSHEIQASDVTFGIIKDKINIIRSGKSLKDKPTRNTLKKYFANLKDEEKLALYKFLDGIGAIITAGLSDDQANEPEAPPEPLDITKKSDQEEEPQQTQQKQAPAPQQRPKQGREDTTPPISVGRQTAESLRREIRSLIKD